jgi:hypothetical protein
MQKIEKAGDIFSFNGKIYTVKSFVSPLGEEFSTLKGCEKSIKHGNIAVKNVEYGGMLLLKDCEPLN